MGIAGGTGSGKTTVARQIAKALGSDMAVIIPQDAYYRDRDHLPMEVREKINYDHPRAFDLDLLIFHLQQLKKGQSIPRLRYHYPTHTRQRTGEWIYPREVIIVEGLMVLEDERLRNLLDVKVFVDTDPDIRFIRRLRRDLSERGRSLNSIISQYLDTVRPMHLKFVEPSKRYADIIISGEKDWERGLKALVANIRSLLGHRIFEDLGIMGT